MVHQKVCRNQIVNNSFTEMENQKLSLKMNLTKSRHNA